MKRKPAYDSHLLRVIALSPIQDPAGPKAGARLRIAMGGGTGMEDSYFEMIDGWVDAAEGAIRDTTQSSVENDPVAVAAGLLQSCRALEYEADTLERLSLSYEMDGDLKRSIEVLRCKTAVLADECARAECAFGVVESMVAMASLEGGEAETGSANSEILIEAVVERQAAKARLADALTYLWDALQRAGQRSGVDEIGGLRAEARARVLEHGEDAIKTLQRLGRSDEAEAIRQSLAEATDADETEAR